MDAALELVSVGTKTLLSVVREGYSPTTTRDGLSFSVNSPELNSLNNLRLLESKEETK